MTWMDVLLTWLDVCAHILPDSVIISVTNASVKSVVDSEHDFLEHLVASHAAGELINLIGDPEGIWLLFRKGKASLG